MTSPRTSLLPPICAFLIAGLLACGGGGSSPVPQEVPKGWGNASLIETSNTGGVETPQIAADSRGNAFAVWTQDDGTRTNIWASRYAAGAGWGAPVLLEHHDEGPANSPQVAVDANGNATAIWSQLDGTLNRIWTNRYGVGTGWGDAVLAESHTFGNATDPHVALDAAGNALAVWRQDLEGGGGATEIWANRTLPGGAWGAAGTVQSWNGYIGAALNLAVDASGHAFAIWDGHDGTAFSILASSFSPGSGWTPAVAVESASGNAYGPSVVLDGSGNALAVWTQYDGIRNNIWPNRYTSAGGWGAPALIETGDGWASGQQAAMDTTGRATAVWAQDDGIRTNIWANRYIPGTGWGTAKLVESDNAGAAASPQVSMDASGHAFAAWVQSDGTRFNAWANRYE